MSDKRPPIKVRFHFNLETGEMELIIDDNAPHLSEEYHDRIAAALASYLGRNPDIEDAGPRHLLEQEQTARRAAQTQREQRRERERGLETVSI